MRNSRKRGTLPRAESQKRLNRDGPNLSRFDACRALASSGFRLFDPTSRESRNAACSDRKVRPVGHNALVTDPSCHVADLQKEDISTPSVREIKDIINVYSRSQ